ncbi:LPXTG cell wall anchor domain-containing protein [Microbacterium sp. LB16]
MSLRIAASALVAGAIAIAPVAPAVAATNTVTSMSGLQAALLDCSTAPNTITLGADIVDGTASLQVGCDTTLVLSTFDLTSRRVDLASGVTFTVAGPTDGSGGTLTADSSGTNFEAGIRTTGSTLTVTGASVVAYGGVNASAIGGDTGDSGGTLNVAGGSVRAIAFPNAYGTAIGGGYLEGSGGIVSVSSGSLYAENASIYGVAIGGGGAGASGNGGAGAAVTVTGGTLTAVASGSNSTAVGGGVSGLNASDRGGAGGSLVIGPGGEAVLESPRSAFGGGWSHFGDTHYGDFGALQVQGTLRLPSGALVVGDDPVSVSEVSIAAGGALLGSAAAPATGASITGTGQIDNQGVIALAPPAAFVRGNNRLLTFDSGAPAVRVFAPTLDAGSRTLPGAPAGTRWNTAADGSGTWFTGTSSTSGSGTTALYAVAPATITASTSPADLTATSGVPYTYPVLVSGVDGIALDPQPAVNFSSTDCTVPSDRVFVMAGACTITATAVVEGVTLSTSLVVTVQAGAPAALTLTPPSTTVDQGGTLRFTLTGTDAAGNTVDTSAAVLTSDVRTDVVDGHSVTFPTASPHTITATLGAATTSIVIQVTPRPAATGAAVLPQTGGGASAVPFVVAGGVVLLLAGVALLIARRRSRR